MLSFSVINIEGYRQQRDFTEALIQGPTQSIIQTLIIYIGSKEEQGIFPSFLYQIITLFLSPSRAS